jgi:class 3 adenylate cyclase
VNEPVVAVRQPGRQTLYVEVHGRLELGRDCDGLLLADAQVSRRHAELRVAGDRLLVVDLGSTNGTFVDGMAAKEPVELRAGSEAKLGETTVTLVAPEPTVTAGALRATTIAAPGAASTFGEPVEDLRRTSIDVVAEDALSDRWQPVLEPSDGGTLTIVFSDIESSTELATRLGDRDWFVVLESHNRIVRARLAHFGGTEVKSQGDGFMLTFPLARRAVLFAIATQRALESERAGGSRGVRVRMGMHTGEAIVDRSGDLFGRHVIVAARVANLADGGEILVSSLVREIVAARGDITFGPAREVQLKGIEGTHLVYAVDWQGAEPAV